MQGLYPAEILHPEATPAPTSLLISTWSIFLLARRESREVAGKTEQIFKQSYEQVKRKDAWNTEKSRGNVMVGAPGKIAGQGRKQEFR